MNNDNNFGGVSKIVYWRVQGSQVAIIKWSATSPPGAILLAGSTAILIDETVALGKLQLPFSLEDWLVSLIG